MDQRLAQYNIAKATLETAGSALRQPANTPEVNAANASAIALIGIGEAILALADELTQERG